MTTSNFIDIDSPSCYKANDNFGFFSPCHKHLWAENKNYKNINCIPINITEEPFQSKYNDSCYFEKHDKGNTESDCDLLNGFSPDISRPLSDASKEEKVQFYWNLCYGDKKNSDSIIRKSIYKKTYDIITSGRKSWSANRGPPSKSCFPVRSTSSCNTFTFSDKEVETDYEDIYNDPVTCVKQHANSNIKLGDNVPSTPLYNVSNNRKELISAYTNPLSNCNESVKKNVKFGSPSVAEFDTEQPASEMTPLPSSIARERFPINIWEDESDEESERMHIETARNAATLAIWDDYFDSYVQLSDDSDNNSSDGYSVKLAGKYSVQTSNKHRSRKRNCNLSNMLDNRRSSTIFSSKRRSLIDDGNNDISMHIEN